MKMNRLYKQFILWIISIIVIIENSIVMSGKGRKIQDDNSNKSWKDSIKGEPTCVSGYCLDPTYNKLELPSSKPSHVRINLEVTCNSKYVSI